MVMAAGPEMNDPAADAMTTAPRLRGTCPPIRAKTHTNTETIHKSNDWLPAPYSFLCRYFTTSSTKKKNKKLTTVFECTTTPLTNTHFRTDELKRLAAHQRPRIQRTQRILRISKHRFINGNCQLARKMK